MAKLARDRIESCFMRYYALNAASYAKFRAKSANDNPYI